MKPNINISAELNLDGLSGHLTPDEISLAKKVHKNYVADLEKLIQDMIDKKTKDPGDDYDRAMKGI